MPEDRGECDKCVFRCCRYSSYTDQTRSEKTGTRFDRDDKSGKGGPQGVVGYIPQMQRHDAGAFEQTLLPFDRDSSRLPFGMGLQNGEAVP